METLIAPSTVERECVEYQPTAQAMAWAKVLVSFFDDDVFFITPVGYDWYTYEHLCEIPAIQHWLQQLRIEVLSADPSVPPSVLSERAIRRMEYGDTFNDVMRLYHDESDLCLRSVSPYGEDFSS